MPKFKGVIVENNTVESKLNEFLLYKKESGLEEVSLKDYSNKLNIILDMNASLDSLDWSQIVLNIQSMDLSAASKASYLKTLRCFIRWCGIDYHIKITETETVKDTYSDDEIKKLLTKPSRCTFVQLRTYTMLCLAFDTGIRLNSLRNIKICDIQDNNTVVIRKTKTHKVQLLPFSNTTKLAINNFMKHRKGNLNDYLFCDIYGNMMSDNAPKKALTAYCNKVGVKPKGWHCCRHTFSKKFLLDCNQSPFMLQQMLGHSSLEMSKHYCAIFNKDVINNYSSPIESLYRHKIKG